MHGSRRTTPPAPARRALFRLRRAARVLLALAAGAPLAATPAAAQATGTAAGARATDLDAAAMAQRYGGVADRLIDAALADSAAYARLGELVDTFGPRIAGSAALERAIDWAVARMQEDGLENVHTVPAMVSHWVRGAESAELVEPRPKKLEMLGLGGSIATPPEGVTAPVLVVGGWDDLRAHAAEAKGRIVVYDVPFSTYGETVRYRSRGAIEAAKVGAVASLIRSVTPFSMNLPHTGAMSYDSSVERIPHAALTVEDVMMLHRMQDRGVTPVIRLRMAARTYPDVPSRDVVAEIRGSEKPDEVVVIGGHIDSWDVGQGAMDDGGGVVVSWEALRLMKRLGLRPRRTVRVVLWVDEEHTGAGGRAYADSQGDAVDEHVLAIESDDGVFKPLGFGFTGPDDAFTRVAAVGKLLDRIGAGAVSKGGGGADIAPLMRRGVPGMGLVVQGDRYFWYHHTNADTLDKLDPADVAECVAAMAVMAYVVADLPQPLPHGPVTR